ncbi:hypothetical protein C0Q70_11748 [Pomacea canaliculata]|uniref:Uncharacterized protein n=1 Tax=Pomacea canaliculata TaxID=400727 RepID=A0A2T7P6W7_POMCA|nr:hypothetical protein C0Q70_11748 [Pomacea canaliculata]
MPAPAGDPTPLTRMAAGAWWWQTPTYCNATCLTINPRQWSATTEGLLVDRPTPSTPLVLNGQECDHSQKKKGVTPITTTTKAGSDVYSIFGENQELRKHMKTAWSKLVAVFLDRVDNLSPPNDKSAPNHP